MSNQENIKKHMAHPFYTNAHEAWMEAQKEQITKGANKYPEPFTPSSWTFEELIKHGEDESVDGWHYLQGLKEKREQDVRLMKWALNAVKYIEDKLPKNNACRERALVTRRYIEEVYPELVEKRKKDDEITKFYNRLNEKEKDRLRYLLATKGGEK